MSAREIVEARQLTWDNGQLLWPWWKWCGAKTHYTGGVRDGLTIWTPDGYACAQFGDWIVKDSEGAFWVVKPDVFAADYDQSGEATR